MEGNSMPNDKKNNLSTLTWSTPNQGGRGRDLENGKIWMRLWAI
jgi:hypothetical protein